VKTCFDGVLIDAPCSGIGTWHRNPTPLDGGTTRRARTCEVQQKLLAHAAASVKSGAN